MCREFGVEYKNFPTFWSCLDSVHRFMDKMSIEPPKVMHIF